MSRDVINTVRGFSQPAKSEILQDSENVFLRNPYLCNLKIQTIKNATWNIMNGGAILLWIFKGTAVRPESLRPHSISEPPWKRSTSCFPDNHGIELFSRQAFPSAASSLSHYTVWGRWWFPRRWSRGKLELKWGVLCPLCRAGLRRTPGSSGPSLAAWPTCFHLLANCRRSIAAKLPALAGKTACG